jgi:glycosyltransferase involved in cell wall biosynthesis
VRILYVLDTQLPDSGADTEQVVNTLAALARRGHRMALLIPGATTGPASWEPIRSHYEVAGEVTVHLLRWRGRGLRGIEKWAHAFRAVRHPAVASADLIYTRNLPTAWRFLGAGHRVAYEHFRPWGDQFPPLQPALRAVLRHPGLVGAAFHSHHTLESYRRLGVAESRMLVAHNGWDPTRLEPRLSRAEARARLGLPAARFTVVYSGRLNARKGLDVVLEVARATPEFGFLLIGSEGRGPIETAAREIPNVTLVPWQRFGDLAAWLYASDVLIIPPSLEPLERHGNTVLPLKLFLYLGAGRVLVAPHAPDTAELLRDGVNAALVPAGDVGAISDRLRGLAADPATVDRLASGALATAQDLTWDRRAEVLEAFLESRLALPAAMQGSDPWNARAWLRECAGWAFHLASRPSKR